MEERLFNIGEIIDIFRKRILILIICVLALTGLAFLKADKMQPYSLATTKIYISENEDLQYNYTVTLKAYREALNSYIEMIRMNGFMDKAAKRLDIETTAGELNSGLGFYVSETVPVISISFTSSTAERAESILKAFRVELQDDMEEAMPDLHTGILQEVNSITNYPNKTKVIIIGLLAGLVIGIGAILVLDYLDDTITKKEDLEKLLPIPVLEEIPFEVVGLEKDIKHKKIKSIRKNKSLFLNR